MRLIRLTTENSNGIFDSQFFTDIDIKKDQKIALQSASFQEVENTLVLDNTNNDIIFDYDVSNNKDFQISLTEGNYDDSNFQTLLDEITNKLNDGIPYEAGKAIGIQFLASRNNNNKIQIGYRRDVLRTIATRLNEQTVELYKTTQGLSALQYTVAKEASQPDTTDDECKYISKLPIGHGSKCFRLQLNHFTDNGNAPDFDNGFIMGLTNISPDEWRQKTTMSVNDAGYYVQFVRAGANYLKKQGAANNLVDTGITASAVVDDSNDNDYIEFSVGSGRLKATIYSTNPDTTTDVIDTAFFEQFEYYPYISFQGSQNSVKVMKVRNNMDPYHHSQVNLRINDLQSQHGPELGANAPPQVADNPTSKNSMILSDDLSSFFGYAQSIFLETAGNVLSFASPKIFTPTLSNVGFIVELNNIQIDSYNSSSGERQNILASIPQNTSDRAIVEYEANNLYFINVKQDISLRNIKARILRIDESIPVLQGTSVLTLLVE